MQGSRLLIALPGLCTKTCMNHCSILWRVSVHTKPSGANIANIVQTKHCQSRKLAFHTMFLQTILEWEEYTYINTYIQMQAFGVIGPSVKINLFGLRSLLKVFFSHHSHAADVSWVSFSFHYPPSFTRKLLSQCFHIFYFHHSWLDITMTETHFASWPCFLLLTVIPPLPSLY